MEGISQFILIPQADYQQLTESIQAMRNDLAELKKTAAPKPEEELITKGEAAKFLKRSLTCLTDWQRRGYLTPQRIGRKIYYKKSDLVNIGAKGGAK